MNQVSPHVTCGSANGGAVRDMRFTVNQAEDYLRGDLYIATLARVQGRDVQSFPTEAEAMAWLRA